MIKILDRKTSQLANLDTIEKVPKNYYKNYVTISNHNTIKTKSLT